MMTAKATKSELRAIRKYITEHRPEVKFYEVQTISLTTGGVITPLYATLVQGDTDSTRTGTQIHNTKLHLRWSQYGNTIDVLTRVIVFYDKASNGVLPAVADVLDSASFNSIIDHVNCTVNKRFVILYDQTRGQNLGGPTTFHEEWTTKFEKTLGFIGNAGTAADLGTNQVYFLVISSSTTALSSATSSVRLRGEFTDQ
jgi:hypothetical protein